MKYVMIIVLLAVTLPVRADGTAAVMADAAQAFVGSLDDEQRSHAALDFDADERADWHFVPRRGHGLHLSDMTDAQRIAAHALLRSGLSSSGYLKAAGIFHQEELIGRDPEMYRIAVFGEPGDDAPWGWRVEGHHISLTFTVSGDDIAVTPSFWGSQPTEVKTGPYAGLQVLGREIELARRLMDSFDDTQRDAALIGNRAPRDIIMSPGADDWLEPQGGRVGDMDRTQQGMALGIVFEYVHNLRDDLAEAKLEAILATGVDDVRFAWAGSRTPGEGHYFRVQGPSFIVEYVNVQNGANHAHSVWRDRDDDFGRAMLRAHHAAEHDG